MGLASTGLDRLYWKVMDLEPKTKVSDQLDRPKLEEPIVEEQEPENRKPRIEDQEFTVAESFLVLSGSYSPRTTRGRLPCTPRS